MKLWIKIAIITAIIVLLAIVFFPKSAGVEVEDCSCVGYKYHVITLGGPGYYDCAGIPYNCVEGCNDDEESDTCTVSFD